MCSSDLCDKISIGCYREAVRGGFGPVLNVGPGTLYGMAKAEAGFSGEAAMHRFVGALADLGLVWPSGPWVKFNLDLVGGRRFGPRHATEDVRSGEGGVAWLSSETSEWRLSIERQEARSTLALGAYYFY